VTQASILPSTSYVFGLSSLHSSLDRADDAILSFLCSKTCNPVFDVVSKCNYVSPTDGHVTGNKKQVPTDQVKRKNKNLEIIRGTERKVWRKRSKRFGGVCIACIP
jgi:hypothetical protein